MKNNILILLVMTVAAFISGYILKDGDSNIEYKYRVERDTIIKTVKSEPIVIEKIKPKIIYRRDTVIKTKPFAAVVDTVIKRDTVYAEYMYPDNLFSIEISTPDDSIMIPQITEYRENKNEWWEKPLFFITGSFVGYLLGN